MIKLYDYFRSSACFRVRIALNLKQLDYQLIPVHLLNNGGEQFTESYAAINPQNLVPTLLDKDKVLTQSLAIIEYLDETYSSPPLFPSEIYEKTLVKSFAFSIAADIHPLNNLRVLKYLTQEFNLSEEQKKHGFNIGLQKD
jgi:maleylacetoacetate isomerase